MMNYDAFKQAVVAAAQAQGLTEYDLYYTSGSATAVTAYGDTVDSFSDTATMGVCFRCIVAGKMGYSNTQKLSEDEAVRLVHDAMAGAQVIEADGFAQIYAGDQHYAQVPQAEAAGCDVRKLEECALSLERAAQALDARAQPSLYAGAEYSMREVRLFNSHGVDLVNRQAGYDLGYMAMVAEGDRKYAGFEMQQSLSFDELDIQSVAAQAVQLAVGSIGGRSVRSGSYSVVFSPRMMAELLGCFAGIFSGDAAQKGLSLLAGKEGTAIGSTALTIVDDPHFAQSHGKTPFDDEGVATRVKTLVREGVLETLLYDLKSAAKAGLKSTGNGRRAGYAGDVNVAPFTIMIPAGQLSQADLMARAGDGLFITELKGMHSGSNPVTGDFSLEAKGYVIEQGKKSRPAEQFTVAGNFYQVMKDVVAVGDDFLLGGGVGTPSVLIGNLSVAGEE